jgi:hypothetical protein
MAHGRKHLLNLPAVVRLVLEQVAQQVVAAVALHAVAAVDHDHRRQVRRRQPQHMRQQARVRRRLPLHQRRQVRAGPRLVQGGVVNSAPLQCGDVEPVDHQRMVQRGADRPKERRPRRRMVRGGQQRAGAVRPGIGQTVHLRKLAPGARCAAAVHMTAHAAVPRRCPSVWLPILFPLSAF